MILNTQVKQTMPVGYLKSVDKKALVALFKDRRSNDTKSFGDKTTKIIAAVRQFIDPDITDKEERWNEIQRVLANMTDLDEIAVAISLATNEDGEDLSDGTKKNLLNVWGQWHFGNDPFSPAFNATLADLTELMNINLLRIKAGGGVSLLPKRLRMIVGRPHGSPKTGLRGPLESGTNASSALPTTRNGT